MNNCIRLGMCLMVGTLAISPGVRGEEAAPSNPAPQKPERVQIGMPANLFQGVPEFLRGPLSAPFKQMMKEQTGIEGDVVHLPDAMTAADQLNEGKLHLAVFQGHEFAWAKSKYDALTPLAVVVPNQPPTQAFLVVRWDCEAKDLAGLNNKIMTLPPGTRDHTRLFLDLQKKTHLATGSFKANLTAASVSDALYDVIEKKAQITCVDSVGLEYFRTTNPGQYRNLKILAESLVFPQACIAVKKNQLDEQTVKKLQETLLKATTLNEGKKMMTLWKLQKFDEVPINYEQQLKACSKVFPLSGKPQESKNK